MHSITCHSKYQLCSRLDQRVPARRYASAFFQTSGIWTRVQSKRSLTLSLPWHRWLLQETTQKYTCCQWLLP